MHVHKGGGSTFCQSAIANGECVGPGNCNLQLRLNSTFSQALTDLPLEERRRLFEAVRVNFSLVAIEHPFAREPLIEPTLVRYITVLRNPVDRMISHWLQDGRGSDMLEFASRNVNFMLHTITHERCDRHSDCSATVALGKRRLEDFALVLDSPSRMSEPEGACVLRSTLGWSKLHVAGTRRQTGKGTRGEYLNRTLRSVLYDANRADVALWLHSYEVFMVRAIDLGCA